MRVRNLLLGAVLGLGLASASSSALLAQTSVHQVDADTLRVVQYKGKPPYKRVTISKASNPEAYAYYIDRIDYNPQPLFSVARGGAPGKSLPRNAQRVSGEQQEEAEFARFEEGAENSSRRDGRQWRGAPGKSNTPGR